MDPHGFLALGCRRQPGLGARFVDNIDGLVGQVAVIDEARRQFGRRSQRRCGKTDRVMLLKLGFETPQYFNGLLDAGLGHVDFLETP